MFLGGTKLVKELSLRERKRKEPLGKLCNEFVHCHSERVLEKSLMGRGFDIWVGLWIILSLNCCVPLLSFFFLLCLKLNSQKI